jgi:hypothetical protein
MLRGMNLPLLERRGIPLRADPAELARVERLAFLRSIACRVLAKLGNVSPQAIAQRAWPDDSARIARAATTPYTTVAGAAAGLSQTRIGDLLFVAPGSAAAQLFARCMRLDFSGGVLEFNIPHAVGHAVPLFAGEGLPIAVVMSPVAATTVGPVKKLAFITTFSRELQAQTPENLAVLLGRLLGEGAAKSLDAAVFSAVAADSTRPAGLLNGVTALPGATGGATTADNAAADLAGFAQAMSDSMINPENMVVIAPPKSAMNLRLAMGYAQTALPIFMSPALTAGTVIACAPEVIVSGYDGGPEVEVAQFPSLHFDDTVPLDIVGTAGTVAAPARSTFQNDLLALKLRVKCAWAAVQPGAVQYTTTAKW